MGFERLREKYGNASTGRAVVDRAIRDEIPGGGKTLELLVKFRERQNGGGFDAEFFNYAFQTLSDANQEMADAVLGKDWRSR